MMASDTSPAARSGPPLATVVGAACDGSADIAATAPCGPSPSAGPMGSPPMAAAGSAAIPLPVGGTGKTILGSAPTLASAPSSPCHGEGSAQGSAAIEVSGNVSDGSGNASDVAIDVSDVAIDVSDDAIDAGDDGGDAGGGGQPRPRHPRGANLSPSELEAVIGRLGDGFTLRKARVMLGNRGSFRTIARMRREIISRQARAAPRDQAPPGTAWSLGIPRPGSAEVDEAARKLVEAAYASSQEYVERVLSAASRSNVTLQAAMDEGERRHSSELAGLREQVCSLERKVAALESELGAERSAREASEQVAHEQRAALLKSEEDKRALMSMLRELAMSKGIDPGQLARIAGGARVVACDPSREVSGE